MTTQPKDLMTLEETIASLVKERDRAKSGIARVTKGIADYEAEGDLHSKSICELSLLDWQEMLSRAESSLHHLEAGRKGCECKSLRAALDHGSLQIRNNVPSLDGCYIQFCPWCGGKVPTAQEVKG